MCAIASNVKSTDWNGQKAVSIRAITHGYGKKY